MSLPANPSSTLSHFHEQSPSSSPAHHNQPDRRLSNAHKPTPSSHQSPPSNHIVDARSMNNNANRSHAPGLPSNAFRRPLSSQRLQYQRGHRPALSSQDDTHRIRNHLTPPSTNVSSPFGRSSLGSRPPLNSTYRSVSETGHTRSPSHENNLSPSSNLSFPNQQNSPSENFYYVNSESGEASASPSASNPQYDFNLDLSLKPLPQPGGNVSAYHQSHISSNVSTHPTLTPSPNHHPRSYENNPTFRTTAILSHATQDNPSSEFINTDYSHLTSIPNDNFSANPNHPSASAVYQPSSRPDKNYQHHQGNAVFCLGGRLLNTHDRPINIATGALVIVPSTLFFIYSAEFLWKSASPALPICFAYVFLICISSFLHASTTDPGILPRNLHVNPPTDPKSDLLEPGPPLTSWVVVLSRIQRKHASSRNASTTDTGNAETKPRKSTNEPTVMEVPVKYCKTCCLWRPPRAHHCRVCDACIETQDHHCVWLNNCVGRRNYRFFLTFVACATLLGILLFVASLVHILVRAHQTKSSFGKAAGRRMQERVALAMMIYALLATPYPLSLFGYHLFLTARGETTREYLNSRKFPKSDRHRPFTLDYVLYNWIAIFNRPRPPSYMRFKDPYTEGDQRFVNHRKVATTDADSGVDFSQGRGVEMVELEFSAAQR